MSSYRLTLEIRDLATGVSPERVLPGIASGVRELANVEAADLRVVRGRPETVIRFTAAGDGEAIRIAQHGATVARALATTGPARITRRDGGRWTPLG